ncbi:hypothetical protein NKH17_24630 [Mesorhizobium sp. M1334]
MRHVVLFGWPVIPGYMIRICDAVLAEMILEAGPSTKLAFDEIGYYDIDKARANRKQAADIELDGREDRETGEMTSKSRFNDLGKQFDIISILQQLPMSGVMIS